MSYCETEAPGIDEQLETEDEVSQQRERLAGVLIDGDEPLEGYAALARRCPRQYSRKRLSYALPRYPEFAFVHWDGSRPITMESSWSNVDYAAIETRIRAEQQDRGRARGKLNKEFPALGIDQSSGSNIAAGAAHQTTVNSASNLATICYHSEPIRADLTALRAQGDRL